MNEAQRNECPIDRLVMRLRLAIVRAVCWMLLPRNVWVGKHFGAYTCRWSSASHPCSTAVIAPMP